MIHLDPRHTNRSPWTGPAQPKLAWTFDAGGAIEAAPALLEDGTIVVATLDGKVHGVTPDGRPRFRVDLSERLYSSPLVLDGRIFVGSDGGRFLGLQPSGNVMWRLETDGDADTGAAPTPWGAIVFASGKVLYAVKPDGTLLWRVKARGKIYSSPAVGDDGTVFVGSQDDHVYAVLPDGKVRWSVGVGADVDCAPAVAEDGTVFVGTDGGEVVAIAGEHGSLRWRARVGGFVRGSLSITRDGTVLAATYGPTPRVVGLWGENGRARFEFKIAGTGAPEFGIHGSPVEDAEGRLYFGAQDDGVYALTSDGRMVWSYRTGADVDAPLVITSSGMLLAGSDDGRLYAFEGKSQ
jgi:outer membrane protein assembly factor BamB